MWTYLGAMECRLPYEITQCYLPPDMASTPSRQAGCQFTYPTGIEGWVYLPVGGWLYAGVVYLSTDRHLIANWTYDLLIVSLTLYHYSTKVSNYLLLLLQLLLNVYGMCDLRGVSGIFQVHRPRGFCKRLVSVYFCSAIVCTVCAMKHKKVSLLPVAIHP